MQVSEEGHHVALVPGGGPLHPEGQVLQRLGGQHISTVQLAAPNPLQEGPI